MKIITGRRFKTRQYDDYIKEVLYLVPKIGVIEGMAIGLAVFGLQITFSQWWLSRHAYGPLEWVWRSLMYGQRQAWRRTRDV